jgi:hypothetical protein
MGSRPKSAPPPSNKKLSKDEAKQTILSMVTLSQKPLLIGVAAMRLGYCWSLTETEDLFQELLDEGRIRAISKDEMVRYDLRDGFVLV